MAYGRPENVINFHSCTLLSPGLFASTSLLGSICISLNNEIPENALKMALAQTSNIMYFPSWNLLDPGLISYFKPSFPLYFVIQRKYTKKCIEKGLPADLKYYEISWI